MWSWDPHKFVGLEAYAPTRIFQAIGDGKLRVAGTMRPVHGLQEEVLKVKLLKLLGLGISLRVDQLKFLP